MTQHVLNICYLYPHTMRANADGGNLTVVQQRCIRRLIDVQIHEYHPGSVFPQDVDLILAGGAQDSGQRAVVCDLPRLATPLRELIEAGVPALAVHGSYQLFGKSFETNDGQTHEGLGIFDVTSTGGANRAVGNVVIEAEGFGTVIGYENHSGRTTLNVAAVPFGRVTKGVGNNDADMTDGARYKNALGTYLHGPLLAANPQVVDFLIATALKNKYLEVMQLAPLNEEIIASLREIVLARPR